MSRSTGTTIVARCIDAMNRGDAAGYAAEFATDAIVHDPSHGAPLTGREAIEADVAALLAAVPDIQGTIRSVIEDEDRVAAAVDFRGTFTGPYRSPDGELPPTGGPVVLQVHDLVELGPDGLATEERRYYDAGGFLAQLRTAG